MSASNVAPAPHLVGALVERPAGRLSLYGALVGWALLVASVGGYFGSPGLVGWQAAHNAMAALVPALWFAGGGVSVLALALGLLRFRAGGRAGVVVALVGLLACAGLFWGALAAQPF